IDEVENIITEANKVIEKSKEKIEELIELAQQKKSIIYRLSNNKAFSLTIGKRVLNSELIKNGTIPVYSANVNIPFGYVNNTILHDFSSPSVLWGIDGDWMVNYISSGIHFYPTDHCGVLRVLTHEISPKYLSFIFNKLGKQQGFCRKLRASIDRVSGLSVELPNYAIQVETASQIEQLELKIIKARDSIEDAINKKQIIIEKYLQNER
ncbi:MAG: hypothetical protein UHE91_08315, partial [Bacteroidales bacterium]|nr:hypothetical protein [Bacteroidales bacterium]